MPSIKELEQREKHRAEKAERKRQAEEQEEKHRAEKAERKRQTEEHEIQEAKNRAKLHAEEMVRLDRRAILHTSKYTRCVKT
jgi:hypothetical protein